MFKNSIRINIKREDLGIMTLLRDQSVVITWLSREPEGLIGVAVNCRQEVDSRIRMGPQSR